MSKQECIEKLSDYIFWDVDRKIVDTSDNAAFIIQRVLEYGQWTDWQTTPP